MGRPLESCSATRRPFLRHAFSQVVAHRSARVAALLLALFGGGTSGCQTQHRPLPDTSSAKIEVMQDPPVPSAVSVPDGSTWATTSEAFVVQISEGEWLTHTVYTYPKASDVVAKEHYPGRVRKAHPGEHPSKKLSKEANALIDVIEPLGIREIMVKPNAFDNSITILLSTENFSWDSEKYPDDGPKEVFDGIPDVDREEICRRLATICTGQPGWRLMKVNSSHEKNLRMSFVLVQDSATAISFHD